MEPPSSALRSLLEAGFKHANDLPVPSEMKIEMISTLKQEDINTIACNIVGAVMGFLSIDTIQGEVLNSINTYDPDSKMMNFLLPKVEKLLQDAFSTPAMFEKEGLHISFFAKDKTGLLDDAADLSLEKLVQKIKIESLECLFKLSDSQMVQAYHVNCLEFDWPLILNGNKNGLKRTSLNLLNACKAHHHCM